MVCVNFWSYIPACLCQSSPVTIVCRGRKLSMDIVGYCPCTFVVVLSYVKRCLISVVIIPVSLSLSLSIFLVRVGKFGDLLLFGAAQGAIGRRCRVVLLRNVQGMWGLKGKCIALYMDANRAVEWYVWPRSRTTRQKNIFSPISFYSVYVFSNVRGLEHLPDLANPPL